MLVIRQPRWHDRKVLIAKYKVKDDNLLTFTETKQLADKVFKIKGAVIKKYPLESNGVIDCYAVPLELFGL
jgi:hypothetical protein